jgi:hypothetical protein
MMFGRWDEFSWWYAVMPFVMVPFWVAFVWVVIAKIRADHNEPPPFRLDAQRIRVEGDSRGDIGTSGDRPTFPGYPDVPGDAPR